MKQVENWYGRFLGLCLRNRYTALAFAVMTLILTIAFVKSSRIGLVPGLCLILQDFRELIRKAFWPWETPEEIDQRVCSEE